MHDNGRGGGRERDREDTPTPAAWSRYLPDQESGDGLPAGRQPAAVTGTCGAGGAAGLVGREFPPVHVRRTHALLAGLRSDPEHKGEQTV